MKIRANEEYYLAWRNNPDVWNDDLKNLALRKKVEKVGKKYYTRVIPHYSCNTKKTSVVDCTCNQRTGDYYPINTSLLKEI